MKITSTLSQPKNKNLFLRFLKATIAKNDRYIALTNKNCAEVSQPTQAVFIVAASLGGFLGAWLDGDAQLIELVVIYLAGGFGH